MSGPLPLATLTCRKCGSVNPMPARQFDLDVVVGGRCCPGRPGLRDNLHRQKARLL